MGDKKMKSIPNPEQLMRAIEQETHQNPTATCNIFVWLVNICEMLTLMQTVQLLRRNKTTIFPLRVIIINIILTIFIMWTDAQIKKLANLYRIENYQKRWPLYGAPFLISTLFNLLCADSAYPYVPILSDIAEKVVIMMVIVSIALQIILYCCSRYATNLK